MTKIPTSLFAPIGIMFSYVLDPCRYSEFDWDWVVMDEYDYRYLFNGMI
jgi:hypothetical protein